MAAIEPGPKNQASSMFSASLAEAGISVNAVSAFYHDHLFVPEHRADEALALLHGMSARVG